MVKHINEKNIFNIILFIWIVSIPFKDAIYQVSTGLIILYFFIFLVKNNDYLYFKEILLKYKDLFFASTLIILSMTISNFVNDVSQVKAWNEEFNFFYRYILIFFIFIYLYSKELFSKKTLLIFIFIALFIQALDGIYQAVNGIDFFKNRIGNISRGLTAVTFNRNVYGMLMGVSIILSFLILDKKRLLSFNNLIIYLMLACFSFSLMFTFTRSAWLSLLIVFFIYIYFNRKKIDLKKVFLFFLLLFVIVLIFYNIESLHNRINSLLEGNSSGRFIIWPHAISLILEKPFFGWGLDTWQIYGTYNLHGLHNSILEVLFCLGLFGFLSFLYLLKIVFKTIRSRNSVSYFLVSIYFFILSQFEQSITHGTIFLSCLVILMFYIFSYRIDKE